MANLITRRIPTLFGQSAKRKSRKHRGRVIRDINGFKMHLDLDDGGISRGLASKGSRERAFMYLLEHEIHDGMVCLDLGANIGYATLTMCREAGETGFIYAIEPSGHNIGLLRDNIRDNHYESQCEITQGLISEKSGTMNFWLSSHSNLGSVQKKSHSVEAVTLEAYSLMDFLKDRRTVNFIKMDVEGHEVEILRGAIDGFVRRPGPLKILFEVHVGAYRPEDRFDLILHQYTEAGFHARYMIGTSIPNPPLFRDAGYVPKHVFYTDNRVRSLYENVRDDDMIRMVCEPEGDSKEVGRVRAVMLQRD